MENKIYDVAIVGGGPAGLTAAIYALRSGLSVVVMEKGMVGGQSSLTYEIKNFPGFEEISGMELAMKMLSQAEKLGMEIKYSEVIEFNLKEKIKTLKLTSEEIKAKTVILCMGAKARPLGVEKEKELIGSGVAYCAVCDGAFYKDKNVIIYGSGESCLEDAVYLSNIAKNLTVVNKRPTFRGRDALVKNFNQAVKDKNIKIFYNTEITGLVSDGTLKGVKVKNAVNGEQGEIETDGLFVANGHIPDTMNLHNVIDCTEKGYIICNENMQTNVAGVFAAGDIINKKIRQVLLACADGAIAATNANEYIKENF